MAKFLDKKERVLDLELTNYGKYLLSVGKFKPTYYAFYDDNVLYDGAYANITESQNNIHKRIKEDTPYLEGLVLFEDIDNKLQKIPRVDDTGLGIITIDTVPLEPEKPRFDNFRYNFVKTFCTTFVHTFQRFEVSDVAGRVAPLRSRPGQGCTLRDWT